MEFIPAKESKWFIWLFKWYTWLLFKRRFSRVWLRQEYEPCSRCKTIYFLNHNSWWDGLIPLLLNEFRFQQNARALMEDTQMQQYSFFRKIGAFSINRNDPRKAITSLRYAVQSMNRDRASLFIYPEGTITPAGTTPEFEGGLAWLHSKVAELNVHFVPVAIHMQTIRRDKPELHLHVGKPVSIPESLSNQKKTWLLEEQLNDLLEPMQKKAGFQDDEEIGFERMM